MCINYGWVLDGELYHCYILLHCVCGECVGGLMGRVQGAPILAVLGDWWVLYDNTVHILIVYELWLLCVIYFLHIIISLWWYERSILKARLSEDIRMEHLDG